MNPIRVVVPIVMAIVVICLVGYFRCERQPPNATAEEMRAIEEREARDVRRSEEVGLLGGAAVPYLYQRGEPALYPIDQPSSVPATPRSRGAEEGR